MTLPKFTSFMLSNQPDQTAYLLNKLVQEGVGGGGEGGRLYPGTGQHTDGAMTQKATTDALGTKADSLVVGQQLATKVDKVAGKELSDNNFTDEELAKLNGIEAGAEVNVQSDWDQTDTSADDYIKNKPTIPTATSDLQNDSGFISTVQTGDIADEAVTSSKIDFTLQSGTITIPAGSNVDTINTSVCYCRKFGNIVDIEIRGRLVADSSWTANGSVLNQLLIPEGFRPASEITCAGYISGHGALIFWIDANGNVELRPTETFTVPTGGTPFGGHTMFIIS